MAVMFVSSNLGLGLLCFQFLGLQRNFLCCQCILKSAGTCFYDCINAEPTGLLIDAAMELVTPWVKEISVDERREALFRASKYALTRGVTTVIDLGRYFPGTTDELSWKDFQGAINCSIDPEWDELSYPHLHTAREKLMTL